MDQVMKLGTKNVFEEHLYSPDSSFNANYYNDLDITKSRKSRDFRGAVVIKLPNQWEHVAHIVLTKVDHVNIEGKDWIKVPYAFYSREYKKWKSDVTFLDPNLYMRICIKHDLN